ncbi:MAG TPA: hypothetical protein VGP41_13015 [Candidatus Lustribacter sp.]|nr:hypothetical protein [Candidatus Lustribacter sp.]
MTQAQTLAKALNVLAKSPQFNYSKARATARQDGNVNWVATKARNDDFNAEVDGCETFVMNDGSVCEWSSVSFNYAPKAK